MIRRMLPAIVAAAGVVGLLLWVDTAIGDIFWYGAYVGWSVLLPGTLLYRMLRRTPHSLVDDVAMGAAIGLAAEIAAFSAFAAVGLTRWLIVWPVAVVVPFLAVPSLRRHWRPRYQAAVPLAWSWVVAGIVVFFAGYTAVAGMWGYPPMPGAAGTWYQYDQHFMLSITAELKHHFPPYVPQLTGEPLLYHWFAYAHEAAASTVSGVDTPVTVFRLAPMALSVAAALLLVVAGWRVSGQPWVGAVAGVLTFVFGEPALETLSPYLGSAAAFQWTSHSAIYGWLPAFALLVVVVDRLRPAGLPTAPLGPGGWVLLAVLALHAAGSKSTVLPVVLAGVVLAGVAGLVGVAGPVGGSRDARPWITAAVLAGGALFGLAVLYRFATHGIDLDPLRTVRIPLPPLAGRPATEQAALLAVGLAAYVVYQCARLAGIPVLAWLARRGEARWGPPEWFLAGAVAAGIGGTLLTGHPSTGQMNFIRTGFGFGAILSALGILALVERHRVRPRTVVLTAIVCAAVTALTSEALSTKEWTGPRSPVQLGLTARAVVLYGALAVIAAVAVVAWFVARRAVPRLRGAGVVVALTALLSTGAYGLVSDARWAKGWLLARHPWHAQVTADQATAARWLRDHSDPDDLVATNRHFSYPANREPLAFALEGYSERRLLLGAWGYAPEASTLARDLGTNPVLLPFWKPDVLAANDAVFQRPDAINVAAIRHSGVRWLVADSDAGPVSADLDRFAALRYRRGPVAVYELHAGD